MQTKTILAATFVLPLLVLACNRDEPSPTASTPSQEKQAQAPSSPDRMLESAPPAAGAPSSADQPSTLLSPPAATGDAGSPQGSQQKTDEPKSAY